jgi:two-component sensor histidine kinase
VDLNNPDETTSIVTYVSGFDIPRRRPGDTIPLVGTISETILRTRTGLLINTTDDGKITGRFSHVTSVATIHAGMRSLISVPLISRDRVIGTLHFRSKKPNAYTERDLRLIERVGDQIAGAIANAQLFLERKQAEVALLRAHDELEQRVANRTEELMRVNEVLCIEITDRKLAEEKLQASLKEKEILLREVNHRVKNNMGVISGLLSLKASSSENPEVIKKLQESKQQIQSMALIHEKLYGEKDWTSIDLGSYIADMVNNLSEFYQGGLNNIATNIKTDKSRLGVDKAIPLGLILNELVSNAFKYAFPKGKQGKVEIVVRTTENEGIELIVRDNGMGLPKGFDPHKTESVGLYLVNGLVKNQLHGEMSVNNEGGTEFRIGFSL